MDVRLLARAARVRLHPARAEARGAPRAWWGRGSATYEDPASSPPAWAWAARTASCSPRPRSCARRGHEIFIVSMTPLGPMGLRGAEGRPPHRVAGDAARRSRSRAGWCGWPAWSGPGGRTSSTATWCMPTSWPGRFGSSLRSRPWSRPSTISTKAAGSGWPRYRLTNGLVDHMTIVSEAAADRFVAERIVPERAPPVIPNGVDTERYRERARRHPGVVCDDLWAWTASSSGWPSVGSRRPRTIPTCSAPSPGCASGSPEALLLLVGRGSLQAETEALARELGLSDGGAVPRRPQRRPGGHERRRRLRHVVGVGRDADGAARGGRGRASHRRHHGSAGTTRWCCDGESGFLVPPRDHAGAGAGDAAADGAAGARAPGDGRAGREHMRGPTTV